MKMLKHSGNQSQTIRIWILDTVVLTIMNDVDLVTTPPVQGDILKYDGTMWVSHTPEAIASIDDISDVDTSTVAPETGQVLKWDGTNFTPAERCQLDFREALLLSFPRCGCCSAHSRKPPCL